MSRQGVASTWHPWWPQRRQRRPLPAGPRSARTCRARRCPLWSRTRTGSSDSSSGSRRASMTEDLFESPSPSRAPVSMDKCTIFHGAALDIGSIKCGEGRGRGEGGVHRRRAFNFSCLFAEARAERAQSGRVERHCVAERIASALVLAHLAQKKRKRLDSAAAIRLVEHVSLRSGVAWASSLLPKLERRRRELDSRDERGSLRWRSSSSFAAVACAARLRLKPCFAHQLPQVAHHRASVTPDAVEEHHAQRTLRRCRLASPSSAFTAAAAARSPRSPPLQKLVHCDCLCAREENDRTPALW
mmetsp:Transcript_27822/g.91044  ORF Transcript_27822/g.91044 Transcript_27822/m.91044 type:complete len:301 (+) Transcript_27822:380-1282(+)